MPMHVKEPLFARRVPEREGNGAETRQPSVRMIMAKFPAKEMS